MRPAVLAVGGTDPLSGAGIVADALTIVACGGHPLTAPTTIVEQDSTGVRTRWPVPLEAVRASVDAALRDARPRAVKIGLVDAPAQAETIAAALSAAHAADAIVVDPVLSGGVGAGARTFTGSDTYAPLLALGAERTLLLTPNANELAALLGEEPARDVASLRAAATRLAAQRGVSVLAKGGHLDVPGTDVLVHGGDVTVFAPHAAVPVDVHGTGCKLSSAIATHLARGLALSAAVEAARAHLADAFARDVRRVGTERPQFVARER